MLRSTVAHVAVFAAFLASGVHADEILHFTTTPTASGIRGQGITYKGYIHPRSRRNFVTSAVFSDVDLPSSVIMIANSGDSTIDPVTRKEIPESDTHEVLVGRSIDGGTSFSFRRALRWTNGLRMVRVVMVPDPGRDRVWTGLAQVYRNVANSPSEELQGTTRIEIDWALKVVRLTKATGTGWDDYPFGTTNPPEPGYLPAAIRYIRFSHLASVTVSSGQRFEAWATEPAEPQGASQICGGTDPEYVQNTEVWAQQAGGIRRGVRILWYRFDPPNGIDAGSRKVIGSNVRAFPSDNPRSDLLVTRAELGAEEFLYVGTQDQILCEELVSQNTSGASVRFIRLQYDATADNYTETEHAFLFNVGTPSAPNWTCPLGVSCSANTRNAYAFVGAIPFQSGTTMQIYANVWGGGRPSLPVVGEVGTVQLSSQGPSTAPKVVSLQQVYREPVVFIQPASVFDPSPAVARVTSVGTGSFSVVLQEESTADGVHGSETFSYVVLERGTYRLSDRRVLEIDKLSASSTIPATTTWVSKLDLRDSVDLDTGALGFAQLQSRADSYFAKIRLTGQPVLLDRNHCNALGQCGAVRNARLTFGIENDEKGMRASRQHGQETVGILLLGEKWLGRTSSIYHLGPAGASGFDARRISVPASVVDLSWTKVTFEAPHLGDLSSPILLAWPEGRADSDPVGLRYRSLFSGSVDLALDEDQSWDKERSHSQESMVYWLIGKGTGLIRAQPISLETDHIF